MQCLWISICDWLRITGKGTIDGLNIKGNQTTMEHVQSLKNSLDVRLVVKMEHIYVMVIMIWRNTGEYG